MPKNKKKKPFAFQQDFTLNAQSIDQASESIFQLMLDGGMDRKNALRLRLTTEEIMLNWQQQLGEEALCRIVAGKKMGRATLRLQAHGAQFNPLQSETSDGDSDQKSILSGLGMAPIYRYSNGVNRVLLRIPRKGQTTPAGILIAITLALISGLAILALSSQGSLLKDFCEEMNQVVLFVMGLISKLLPVFIFVSVLQMMLSGMFATVLDAYMLLVQLAVCSLLVMAAYVGVICVKFRIAPGKLIKKLLPTFIIAITTASSAAAFATNSESCEKQLGISRKLTSFGLPLGQVLYKPGVVIMYMLVALFTASACRTS